MRCPSTVRSVTNRACAISLFVMPWPAISQTRYSLGVSESTPVTAGRRGRAPSRRGSARAVSESASAPQRWARSMPRSSARRASARLPARRSAAPSLAARGRGRASRASAPAARPPRRAPRCSARRARPAPVPAARCRGRGACPRRVRTAPPPRRPGPPRRPRRVVPAPGRAPRGARCPAATGPPRPAAARRRASRSRARPPAPDRRRLRSGWLARASRRRAPSNSMWSNETSSGTCVAGRSPSASSAALPPRSISACGRGTRRRAG